MNEFISINPVLHTPPSHCADAITPFNSAGDRQIVTFRINSKTDTHTSQAKVITVINQLATTLNKYQCRSSNGSGQAIPSSNLLKMPTIIIES